MKNALIALTLATGLFACNEPKQQDRVQDATKEPAMETHTNAAYTVDMVQNKKDPACGMPVSAAISDTAHYHGKVLGFCSADCKAEFKKDPKALIAKAEMKP